MSQLSCSLSGQSEPRKIIQLNVCRNLVSFQIMVCSFALSNVKQRTYFCFSFSCIGSCLHCGEVFTEPRESILHAARILPCGHLLCSACLISIASSSRYQWMHCPFECKGRVKRNLHLNFPVLKTNGFLVAGQEYLLWQSLSHAVEDLIPDDCDNALRARYSLLTGEAGTFLKLGFSEFDTDDLDVVFNDTANKRKKRRH